MASKIRSAGTAASHARTHFPTASPVKVTGVAQDEPMIHLAKTDDLAIRVNERDGRAQGNDIPLASVREG